MIENKILFKLLFLISSFCFGQWTQIGSDIDGKASKDFFGRATAISADGSVIAISSRIDGLNHYYRGRVQVFKNTNNEWSQIGNDINEEHDDDRAGEAISINSDGTIIAIGAIWNDGNGNESGHVRVFENVANVWTQIGNDIDGGFEDQLGSSVSLNADGTILATGAPSASSGGKIVNGHVKIFKNISNVWTQIGSNIIGEGDEDFSGDAVSLSSDGSIVAIGAPYNSGNGMNSGHVRVFENISNVWSQIGSDIDGENSGDFFGHSISLNSDGSIIAGSSTNNYSKVFKNISGTWTQIGNNITPGKQVSLNADGSIIAVGSSTNNHTKVFKNISNTWTQISNDINGEASGDSFGSSISINSEGSIVAIGGTRNDGNGSDSGHVRVLENLSTTLSNHKNKIEGLIFDIKKNKIKVNLSNVKIIIFNILGKEFPNENLQGIYIVKAIDEKGNIEVRKVIIK